MHHPLPTPKYTYTSYIGVDYWKKIILVVSLYFRIYNINVVVSSNCFLTTADFGRLLKPIAY